MLLRHGGNPNEVVAEQSVSPMHLAAGLGIRPICLLLQHGGDPNIRLPDGTTPLHVASMWGDSDCVQVLLSNGGDPFIRDQDGFSAMDFARQYKHREVTDIIKKYMYLLMFSDEPTMTPKYTYTRRSMCSDTSSPSLNESNGHIEKTALNKCLQNFTSRRSTSLNEPNGQVEETAITTYLQEFTKRRRSSIYLHSLQQEMNRCFSEGKKTHVMDVTSPDHPYIEPKYFEESPLLDGSDSEDSLHLHLSMSSSGVSTCTDSASFVTCDGEDLDTVIKMSSKTEDLSELDTPKIVLKQPPVSQKGSTVGKSDRRKKYCRRLPALISDTQDLCNERDTEMCEYCGCEIVNRAADNDKVCLACERLGIELEELSLDSSENNHLQSSSSKTNEIISNKSEMKLSNLSAKDNKFIDSKSVNVMQEKLNAHNKSAKIASFLSGTDHNSIDHPLDLDKGFIQSHICDDSLISQDISYVEDKIQKAEFHPSDISTITVSEDSRNNGFFMSGSQNIDTPNNTTLKHQSNMHERFRISNNVNKIQDSNKYNKQTSDTDTRAGNEPKSCSPELDDLWTEVRASAMKAKRERDTKKILDTAFIGRESMISGVSDASTIDYIYTDKENGIVLLERHLPSQCGSIGSRRSLDSLFSANNSPKEVKGTMDMSSSSQDTISYNWREHAMIKSADDSGKGDSLPNTETISEDLLKLSEEEIRSKLKKYWDDPGPITPSTKQMYLKRLSSLQKDPNAKWITKTGPEYPPELSQALYGKLDLTDISAVESKMVEAFQNPNRLRRWREGTLKSSFNYLLLDPRITDNLPNRANNMDDLDIFNTFITSIFYVGKGKRARPYCHLYEAIKHMKKPNGKASRKVQQIIDIWSNGLGVVSLHCFQSVIPVEAYTREACMVDALGLKNLTNMKKGDYYGVSTTFSMKQRRRVGVYLLTKALQIFLAEGERQISPLDLKKDP